MADFSEIPSELRAAVYAGLGVFVILRVVLAIAYVVAYGKLMFDFSEFFVTGHTTNFFWFFGDVFVNPSQPQNNPGPHSWIGFFLVVLMGWMNINIWTKFAIKLDKVYARFLSSRVNRGLGYIGRKIGERLQKASTVDNRRGRISTRILHFVADWKVQDGLPKYSPQEPSRGD